MRTAGTLLRKETRALAPALAATLISLGFAAVTPDYFRSRLVLLIFTFGTIALGALPFGYEYTHRTISLMLTQPCKRRQVFTVKMSVLVPMVLLVTAAALAAAPRPLFIRFLNPNSEAGMLLLLAPLCAICLTPALSILCRNGLPAAVFAVAIPGTLAVAANVLGVAIYGFRRTVEVQAFMTASLWLTLPAMCAGGAVASWVLFSRLEAIEGHAELQAPRWLRGRAAGRPAARVRHPYVALLGKELRLQQLTFVVVAFYVIVVGGVWALQRSSPDFPIVPVEAITMMYVALLAVLIGSVASAEERHLGTLPSQLLLPIGARRQWAVKVAATLGLALVLGIALPWIVGYAFAPDDNQTVRPERVWAALAAIIVLTTGSLYVSTLSSSGVRALINSIPAVLAATITSGIWAASMWSVGFRLFWEDTRGLDGLTRYQLTKLAQSRSNEIYIVTALIAASLFVAFAHVNHRSIDGSARRTTVQLLIIAAASAVLLALPIVVFQYYSTR